MKFILVFLLAITLPFFSVSDSNACSLVFSGATECGERISKDEKLKSDKAKKDRKAEKKKKKRKLFGKRKENKEG